MKVTDGTGTFFVDIAIVTVTTGVSWGIFYFAGGRGTLVILLPLVIGVLAALAGYVSGIASAKGWKLRTGGALPLTPILAVVAIAVYYFYVVVLDYIPGRFYWGLIRDLFS